MSATETAVCPLHQWTHDGDKVLLVKCVDTDGKSHGGFRWPESGPVDPGKCSAEPTCESGGLFGWAWGLNLGGGKEPDYRGKWIVFAADPALVVDLSDKQKVAGVAEVVYFGSWVGALERTRSGRLAWINARTKDAPESATGDRGAASATGWRGAASATGDSGAASATGWNGAASATGDSGAASATGRRGAASATGDSGAASATGWNGAASATGRSGAASATGARSIAAVTGKYSCVESSGIGSVAVSTAEEFTWIARPGSVLFCRWESVHRVFVADEIGLADGAEVLIRQCQIVKN